MSQTHSNENHELYISFLNDAKGESEAVMCENQRGIKWLIMCMLLWITGFSNTFSSSVFTLEERINHVYQGQTLFVYLPEEPSMEYRWEVEISNLGILNLIQRKALVPSGETNLVDPDMTLWEFRALHPGFAQILFRLYPNYSDPEYPSDIRVFFLRISDHTDTTNSLELVDTFHEVTVGTQIQIMLEEDDSMGYLWDFEDLSSMYIRFDKKTEQTIKKEGVF